MKYIILFIFFPFSLFCQNKDYFEYHKHINKAEELFFLYKQTDSALYYYDKVFESFDFIFAKDLVNAAQISIYTNKPYQKYIEQGFEYGLKLEHLKNFPLLSKVLPQISKDEKLKSIYKKNEKFTFLKLTLNI